MIEQCFKNVISTDRCDFSDSFGGSGGNYGVSSTSYKGDWSNKELSPVQISKYDYLFKKAANALQIDWRLIAAHSYCESGFRNIGNKQKGPGGIYQFIAKYWHGDAPYGKSDPEYRFNPEVATDAYINRMTKNLKRFKNAASRNDQILLAMQLFHDGSFPATTTYANYRVPQYLLNIDKKNGNHKCEKEAKEYIPKIMQQYKKYGGSISNF